MSKPEKKIISGAQIIVEMLIAYGVKVVFGVPGDTSLPLYDAFYNASYKIRHILARDERSAAFMADTYARLTHKPAVCECPSGAGALYSIPGIAEANASSIPVILLTSGVALSGENKGTITELDEALDNASEYQGPVFIDVVTEPETKELPPVYSWLNYNTKS